SLGTLVRYADDLVVLTTSRSRAEEARRRITAGGGTSPTTAGSSPSAELGDGSGRALPSAARYEQVSQEHDRAHAEALRDEVAAVLRPMGLRLSEEKTTIAHIDEGFDFLGFRIQRRRQRGSDRRFVYTWPSKKALASIKAALDG
ncbi:MAG TPA: hypothetical protein VE466_08145, partial [Acidimicrobiales bacterium]|nr:hypothetical protein [Acidimicrobiales bacterium]